MALESDVHFLFEAIHYPKALNTARSLEKRRKSRSNDKSAR